MSLESVVKRFSYSKLNTYLSCPLRFKYQYVDNLPTVFPKIYVTILGTGVHKVLEHFYLSGDYSEENIVDLWDWVCNKIEEKNFIPILKDEDTDFFGNEDRSRMFFFHGRKMLKQFYHTNKWIFLDPNYQFLHAERPFAIPFHNWTLSGVIDKIESHTSENRVFICDYKTGKVPPEEEVKKSLQATFYSLAYRTQNKVEERGLYFHYIKENKIIKTKRTEEDYNILYNTLETVTNNILTEQFGPIVSSSNCSICQFQDICEAKKGKKNEKTLKIQKEI